MRLLILGGTTEATVLARHVGRHGGLDATLSFAGRTRSPAPPAIPFRVGGFGGVQGLQTYLVDWRVEAVIDATHPFAAQMSRNAAAACATLALPLARLTRPAWRPGDGDRWISVSDMDAAARALGDRARRVFLTIGGLQLAAFAALPQHHYIVRTIEPPDAIRALPSHRLILARGPFGIADETKLMRDERIGVVVTKNSGGAATEAKLAAARALGIEVVMVERPALEVGDTFDTIEAVLGWIEAHRPAP